MSCDCGYPDGDWYACISGYVYGPCDNEMCGGVCESTGPCECTCHDKAAAGALKEEMK